MMAASVRVLCDIVDVKRPRLQAWPALLVSAKGRLEGAGATKGIWGSAGF